MGRGSRLPTNSHERKINDGTRIDVLSSVFETTNSGRLYQCIYSSTTADARSTRRNRLRFIYTGRGGLIPSCLENFPRNVALPPPPPPSPSCCCCPCAVCYHIQVVKSCPSLFAERPLNHLPPPMTKNSNRRGTKIGHKKKNPKNIVVMGPSLAFLYSNNTLRHEKGGHLRE